MCHNISFCVTRTDRTSGKCSVCIAGYAPDSNGNCEACVNPAFSTDGRECRKIDYCESILNSVTEQCVQCAGGYEPIEGGKKCGACDANEYSTGTQCIAVGHCNKTTDKTENKCSVCELGYEVIEGRCEGCRNITYSRTAFFLACRRTLQAHKSDPERLWQGASFGG